MLIGNILQRALRLYPNKDAIVSGENRFSYAQFGERVNRLAHHLLSSGLAKGDCVAILHHNSHEFLEAYFAASMIGAILNPLNIRLSSGELSSILNDSKATLLIAAGRFRDKVEDLSRKGPVLEQVLYTGRGEMPRSGQWLDYEDALKAQASSPPPESDISDQEIAHLYYTSGTTGMPKGVILTHKNITTHALCAIAELKLDDKDVWAHVAPLFHLADAWATFAITWVGGRHVIVPDFDPPEVLSTIQTQKVTLSNLIPTMLNMLVNTPGVETYDFSSLRVLLSGGAPIAPALVRKVMNTFRCDYIQTYGMTETSPYLTVSILKDKLELLPPEEQFKYKAMTGRSIVGVDLKVVRPDGQEVKPDGKEVGEIIVRGDTISPGYWNRSEETEKAFKDGWFFTGDLAVQEGEGFVNIVDRKKDMIVTGGENVYCVEVEEVLYRHFDILEAAVIGVPDDHWGEAVKACIVLKEGKSISETEIIRFCKERIAPYKAPKSVDFCEALPKTGSGKISKKRLKDRYMTD